MNRSTHGIQRTARAKRAALNSASANISKIPQHQVVTFNLPRCRGIKKQTASLLAQNTNRHRFYSQLSKKGNRNVKKLLMLASLALALLGGCASTPAPSAAVSAPESWISPQQAVLLAANAAPASVDGTFAMKVQATGAQRNQTYLNSELDYRDQRNLTVAISPPAAQQLAERLGEHPRSALKGKDILVRGAAVRTKIHFFANGRMTDKYYYQTHVNVSDANQIAVR